MTPLREIVKALREISEGPWYVGEDKAADTTVHKDSGLALVDTGRTEDWPIARLCEWHTAEFIASSPLWLAEMVVRAVEEKRLHYWNFHDSYAITAVLDKCLIKALSDPDINITPEDFAWLKEKVRG